MVFVLLWEGYKLIWTAMGWENPVRPDNRTMPHTWDIFLALFQPAQRNGPPFILVELRAALMTLREAFVGFLIGGAVGLGLGVLFVRSTMSERAFMPYVVASQTVPIIAIAPMVVVWGGRVNLPQWLSVSLIAADPLHLLPGGDQHPPRFALAAPDLDGIDEVICQLTA